MDRQRIDKWLWHARVVRTRSAAAALVASISSLQEVSPLPAVGWAGDGRGAGGEGAFSSYATAWRRINRLPNAMTSFMLFLERRPRLRARAIRALAAEPALFSRLLGIHARTLPPRKLGLNGALRLAWRLVTP